MHLTYLPCLCRQAGFGIFLSQGEEEPTGK